MKPGYIYVLVHPSDPLLVKVGQTTLNPEKRLAQHNSKNEEYTGQVVKETGQKWELKKYIAVPDPSWAEKAFWASVPSSVFPYRFGIEVDKMEWEVVQNGLEAAKKAGMRPPPTLPDWVYAYTAWMNKRLEGRDITLIGRVTSRSGKAVFRCINGHEWRTNSKYVAEGEGCPHCGIGYREPEEIWQVAKLGYICLLIHPDKPGIIKIGLTYNTLEQCFERNVWKDWEVHQYRFVEDPALAERLIWELLGNPSLENREELKVDLSVAEQAFRGLIYQMHREIAFAEKKKEGINNLLTNG